mgnify:CR=1 FL=1
MIGMKIIKQMVIFLNKRNLSIITAQEYIEHKISIIITDLTIMSALKNKLNNEKSVFVPNPTACDAISASMITIHT